MVIVEYFEKHIIQIIQYHILDGKRKNDAYHAPLIFSHITSVYSPHHQCFRLQHKLCHSCHHNLEHQKIGLIYFYTVVWHTCCNFYITVNIQPCTYQQQSAYYIPCLQTYFNPYHAGNIKGNIKADKHLL